MADLDEGITRVGEGYRGKSWNILGQRYFPKASCDSTFAFETNSDPGQHVPVHVHPAQDEFILVLEGELEAVAGRLVGQPLYAAYDLGALGGGGLGRAGGAGPDA